MNVKFSGKEVSFIKTKNENLKGLTFNFLFFVLCFFAFSIRFDYPTIIKFMIPLFIFSSRSFIFNMIILPKQINLRIDNEKFYINDLFFDDLANLKYFEIVEKSSKFNMESEKISYLCLVTRSKCKIIANRIEYKASIELIEHFRNEMGLKIKDNFSVFPLV